MAPGERARLLRRFAAVVDEHVDALRRRIGRHPDTAILGCTHYEIIADLFHRMKTAYQKDGGAYAEPIVKLTWPYKIPHDPSPEEIAKSAGIHINLVLGIGMLVLGLLFLLWAKLAPVVHDPSEPVSDRPPMH